MTESGVDRSSPNSQISALPNHSASWTSEKNNTKHSEKDSLRVSGDGKRTLRGSLQCWAALRGPVPCLGGRTAWHPEWPVCPHCTEIAWPLRHPPFMTCPGSGGRFRRAPTTRRRQQRQAARTVALSSKTAAENRDWPLSLWPWEERTGEEAAQSRAPWAALRLLPQSGL